MCGIGGFLGDFKPERLDEMVEVLAHRGPDDSGTYYDQSTGIGLCHRRLSIIDLSPQGKGPMWDVSRRTVITYNGEIYNYPELRQELIDDGFAFNSHTDTECILNLYIRDGVKMLDRLNGIFAFALWDAQKRELLVVRDGVGVKPLYYSENERGFLFASEMKAMLKEPSIERTIDPEAIHHYLTYLWCPAPLTPFQSIKKLEPGHAMVVRDGRIERHWQFYDLPYDNATEHMPVDEAVHQVRAGIKQAVTRQMIADVPVGAFLSGGLDSSAVAVFAQEKLGEQKLQCFTIGFKGSPYASQDGQTRDLPYAKKVAEIVGVDLHVINVGSDMFEQLDNMIYHLDEPQADPAPINALFICQLAKQHGIKVLLSGAGGDDIFSGYRRHHALLSEKYWAWLPRPVRSYVRKATGVLPRKNALSRRVAKALSSAHLDADERLVRYFHWQDARVINSLYSRDFASQLNKNRNGDLVEKTLSHLAHDVAPLNRMLYLEGKHFLADHNLNYTDKMSMASGVEVRVPFLDPDLISLATKLPVGYKQKGRVGKWIFKKAMEGLLPNDVIYRPKTGFGVPLREWVRDDIGNVFSDVLSETSINNRGIFRYDGVSSLIQKNRSGAIDGAYTIFSLACIELWCRRFVDRS